MKQDLDHHAARRLDAGGENPAEPLLITAADLAQLLNISTRTLWRLLSSGKLIEPVKIGGNTRWRLDEVRRWIADGCPQSDNTKT